MAVAACIDVTVVHCCCQAGMVPWAEDEPLPAMSDEEGLAGRRALTVKATRRRVGSFE